MSTENHGYQLRIVAIVCYVAAVIGVALRFYVKKVVVGKLGYEDWMMAAGLALYTMYLAFVMVGLHYGTGQHHQNLSNYNIQMAVKYWYFGEWTYVLITTTIKYAVGVFYLRIMIRPWQVLLVKCLMAAVVVFGCAYFGCVVAQCVPVPYIWHRFDVPEIYQGGCLPDAVVLWGTYLHSILSAIGDWTLGLLPISLLWNARMGWGTKGMMCLVLGLGTIASTSTLIRISVIHNIIDLDDFLWNTLGIAIWSTVEPGAALLAAGLATIRPLLRSLFPNLFSLTPMQDIGSVNSISALDCYHRDWTEPRTLSTNSSANYEPLALTSRNGVEAGFKTECPPLPSSTALHSEISEGRSGESLMGFGAGLGSNCSQSTNNRSSVKMLGFGAGLGVDTSPSSGYVYERSHPTEGTSDSDERMEDTRNPHCDKGMVINADADAERDYCATSE